MIVGKKLQDEILKICEQVNLPDAGKALVNTICNSEPIRTPHGGGRSNVVHFPSKKMGLIIKGESLNLEFQAILQYEQDDNVVAYYDQPCKTSLTYINLKGKRICVFYVADFLVVYRDKIEIVQWKPEKQLVKLAESQPNRYQKDNDGNWHDIPAEDHYFIIGLKHVICTEKDINHNLTRNYSYISDFIGHNSEPVSEENENGIIQYIKSNEGCSLKDLISIQKFEAADIYKLLVNYVIYIDLSRCPIFDTDKVMVFSNKTYAESYGWMSTTYSHSNEFQPSYIDLNRIKEVKWNSDIFHILTIGLSEITLLSARDNRPYPIRINDFYEIIKQGKITVVKEEETDASTEIQVLLSKASPHDLEMAIIRYKAIEHILHHLPTMNPEAELHPQRTIRYWVKLYYDAQKLHNYGFWGLILLSKKKGNRTERIDPAICELAHEFIVEKYEKFEKPTQSSVYSSFRIECKKRGFTPPSLPWFRRKLKLRPYYSQQRKRLGAVGSYPDKPQYLSLEYTTPRHGDYPFQICHIDHTQLDIELVSSQNGMNLGRPYLTLLIDGFTRKLLIAYISFDPPSIRTIMIVLRKCVLRYHRLPATLVLDKGPDLQSIYMKTTCAAFEITLIERKTREPRDGNIVERIFNTSTTQIINTSIGNTQITKKPRNITQENDPKRLAVWDLPTLQKIFNDWQDNFYNEKPHVALGISPNGAFEKGILLSGYRQGREIIYSKEFYILTCPEADCGGKRILERNRGVKVKNSYYFADEFTHSQFVGQKLPVRIDPFDYSKVFVYHKNRWIVCYSKAYSRYHTIYSDTEIEQLSIEDMRQKTLFNMNVDNSVEMFGQFLKRKDTEEERLIQAAKGHDQYITHSDVISLNQTKNETLLLGETGISRIVNESTNEFDEDVRDLHLLDELDPEPGAWRKLDAY